MTLATRTTLSTAFGVTSRTVPSGYCPRVFASIARTKLTTLMLGRSLDHFLRSVKCGTYSFSHLCQEWLRMAWDCQNCRSLTPASFAELIIHVKWDCQNCRSLKPASLKSVLAEPWFGVRESGSSGSRLRLANGREFSNDATSSMIVCSTGSVIRRF